MLHTSELMFQQREILHTIITYKYICTLEKLSLNRNTRETRLGGHRVASVVSRGSQDPNPTIPPGATAHCHGLHVPRTVTRQPRKPEDTVCTVLAGSPFIPDHSTPVLFPRASFPFSDTLVCYVSDVTCTHP